MATSNFLGLRTVICKVNDLAVAKEWYAKVLGIEPYFDEPFYVGFNVGGYELGLDPDGYSPAVKACAAVAYWGVNDVRSAFDALIAAGASSYEEPADVGGDIIVASVKDPWGNVLGLIYNPHFSTGS